MLCETPEFSFCFWSWGRGKGWGGGEKLEELFIFWDQSCTASEHVWFGRGQGVIQKLSAPAAHPTQATAWAWTQDTRAEHPAACAGSVPQAGTPPAQRFRVTRDHHSDARYPVGIGTQM